MGQNTNMRSQRPNPLILVGIGVLVVILAVVLIVNLSSQKSPKKDSGTQLDLQVYGDYKKEFNKFANYIIEGEESEDPLKGEYESSEDYALRIALKSKDEDGKTAFLEKANKLFETFYHDFAIEGPGSLSVTGARVDNYRNSWIFLNKYLNSKWNTEDDILAFYNELGKDSAETKINESYENLSKSDSTAAQNYAELRKAHDRLILNRIDRYARNGCVKDGKIDKSCVAGLRYDSTNNEIGQALVNLDSFYSSEVLLIVGSSWDISALINNGDK